MYLVLPEPGPARINCTPVSVTTLACEGSGAWLPDSEWGWEKSVRVAISIFSSVFRIPVVAASGEVELAYNNVDHEAIVITAYEPDHETWSGDFTRRRS